MTINQTTMANATLELYNALLEAGVSKDKAEAAAKAVISREQAKEVLITKVEFYKGLILQATFMVSAIGLLLVITR